MRILVSRERRLHIMRGLPGTGKSTMVKEYLNAMIGKEISLPVICSADFYFTEKKEKRDPPVVLNRITSWFHVNEVPYNFRPNLLTAAHSQCQCDALNAMAKGLADVIVDNTNCSFAEYAIYIQIARVFDYDIHIIELHDGNVSEEELEYYFERCTHGVPMQQMHNMLNRWDYLPTEIMCADDVHMRTEFRVVE